MGRRTHARDFLQKINYLQSNERVYIPSKLSKTLHRVGYGVFLPLFRFKMVSPLRFFPRASHTPIPHTRFQNHKKIAKKHRAISNKKNTQTHNTQTHTQTHNTQSTHTTHNTQHTTQQRTNTQWILNTQRQLPVLLLSSLASTRSFQN
jgi:hypothetical protein